METRERASERGGVLLRFEGGAEAAMLGFISASTATRIAALGSIVPVPGAPAPVVGVGIADGTVVTVLRLGERELEASPHLPDDAWPVPGARRAVICRVGGVDVALTGGVVVATGVFDAPPEGDGILWRGQMVPELDVRTLYAQAEAATWAGRAASVRPRVPSAQPATMGGDPPSPPAPPPPVIDDEDDEHARATWLPGDDDARGGRR